LEERHDLRPVPVHNRPVPLGQLTSNIRSLQTMARIPDIDRDVFSNIEKTISDRFTEDELTEIHGIALILKQILKAVIAREDSSQR
jgi:hypothetical protein